GERHLDHPQEVEHDRSVARAPPAVHVGGLDREPSEPASPFEVRSEPTDEGGLPAADPAGEEKMERKPLRERLPVATAKQLELDVAADEAGRKVRRVEGLLPNEDGGHGIHRSREGTRAGLIIFAVGRAASAEAGSGGRDRRAPVAGGGSEGLARPGPASGSSAPARGRRGRPFEGSGAARGGHVAVPGRRGAEPPPRGRGRGGRPGPASRWPTAGAPRGVVGPEEA